MASLGNVREQAGHQHPEEAGPQHNAGDHFPHHLGLANADKNEPHEPTEPQDQGSLDNQQEDEMCAVHGNPAAYRLLQSQSGLRRSLIHCDVV